MLDVHFAVLDRLMSSSINARSNMLAQFVVSYLENPQELADIQKCIMQSELDPIDQLLKDGPFFAPLTSDEIRVVVAAMVNKCK